MWKTITVAFVAATLSLAGGCGSDEPEAISPAQLEAEAREQINESNMEAELDRLEKEVAADEAANP